ncbi:MAG: hypothetical protein A2632_01865 [Candidatus Pacebacteria bacterium RIFCSPHIGHO2_01_FULL_46_16]|nr:MAG: hypothetical protein A2632_01865 [Candidatus Pacebacteria bacterium RIFCSPHIGHO2_01_FULL_46_16]OGJ21996.1 MAG: hypothetical protein A3J60_02805 [Candidatus Pacebacteria bacterium RIFCSPHIGHO2_02_FULL_46_9]OGJ37976.1 MAG: hypothetical protein A3A82_00735 [Candidatus Pacebacteria bacterium RIFCSPLOWO2_01_FULL_47_12]
MALQTISTKTLRTDFSQVLSAMEAGQSLMLLYRSKPLAEIRPMAQTKKMLRSFSKPMLMQWMRDDRLSSEEQKQIDVIINNLP